MSMKTGKRKNRTYPAGKITAAAIAVVVILYAAGGFLVAPRIIKSKLPQTVFDTFGVTTTLKDAAVNPFALSVTLTGFDMKAGEKSLAGFEELYVNFQLSSLVNRAYTFSAIRLVGPQGSAEILPDGSLNWSTLVTAGEETSSGAFPEEISQETVPPSPDAGIIPVLVHQLQIDQGRITFSDLSQQTPFEADLSPIELSLEDFSTRKDDDGQFSFTATLGKGGEVNWEGALSVNPLRSRGRVELQDVALRTVWEYLRDRFNFEITDGSLDVGLQYAFEAGMDANHFELTDGSLTVKAFALCEKGMEEPLISVPLLTCQNVGLNLEKKNLSIGSISSAHADISGWRGTDGTINYQTIFGSPAEKETSTPGSSPDGKTVERAEAWMVSIDALSIEDCGIAFEDRTHATPTRISLDPVDLHIRNMTTRAGSQSEIDLRLAINETGTIQVKGTAGLNPLAADCSVNVSEITLKNFQRYVDPVAKVNITGGTASLDGTVRYENTDNDVPSLRYRGNIRVDGFDAEDKVQSADLLKWQSLVLSDMAVDLSPARLRIADIAFTEPYAKVVIFPDRTVNLATVFAQEEKEQQDQAEPTPSSLSKGTDEGKEAFPIIIEAIRIADGSLNFADLSLLPNFATGIQDLNGSIKGLSSDPTARADVSLTGAVDRYAPVSIRGKINPLSPAKFIDVALSFKNMELTTLTPYSGKFAGYAIEKGKMSLNLDYRLEGSNLIGGNKLFLNQLTLGERVESPSATTLPVTLAIGLLKDRQGNIDIDLPVKGDINNPEFSYGQLVFKAFMNLLTKVVTSPFTLLGSLFGGGEDLSHIDFAYGSAEVTPEQMEKLDILARSLNERPALRLEIRGTADRTSDRAALAEKKVMRTLKKMKADELRAANQKVPPTVDDIAMSDAEYRRLLKKAYETMQKDKDTEKEKTVDTPQAMKRALIDSTPVEEIDLRQLAKERAQQIKGYLIQEGKIENKRVFILDVQVNDASETDTVPIVLSLS